MAGLTGRYGLWHLTLCLALAALASPAGAAVLRLTQAERVIAGTVTPVTLPDAWEVTHAGQTGQVSYRLHLPPHDGVALAVLVRRIGQHVRAELNGSPLLPDAHDQPLGRPWPQAPMMLRLPAPRLLAQGNVLTLHVLGDATRDAGLSEVLLGPADELRGMYRIAFLDRVAGSVVMAAVCTTMGLLAVLAAARTRRTPYAWFGVANLVWAWRLVAPLIDSPPWPAVWQWAFHASYSWFIALTSLYVAAALQARWLWLRRLLAAYVLLAAVAAVWVVAGADAWLRTALLLAGLIVVAVGTAHVLRAAWHLRTGTALLLAAGAIVGTGLGLRDWLVLRLWQDYGAYTWARYAVLLFLLVLAWTLVDELARSLRALRASNEELQRRLARQRLALEQAFEHARKRDRREAARAERDHLLREMHDGVGGHLVGALALARALMVPPAPDALARHAQALVRTLEECLMELRQALDTLDADARPLADALADLRWHVAPSLRAAGVRLQWEMEEDAADISLPAGATLQVQRIVREALTNTLKHAAATQVSVHIAYRAQAAGRAPELHVLIEDDGQGRTASDAPATQGHGPPPRSRGIESMHARAQRLGGLLNAGPTRRGWEVHLRLPCAVAPTPAAAMPVAALRGG